VPKSSTFVFLLVRKAFVVTTLLTHLADCHGTSEAMWKTDTKFVASKRCFLAYVRDKRFELIWEAAVKTKRTTLKVVPVDSVHCLVLEVSHLRLLCW
jgi:hypothetical protein